MILCILRVACVVVFGAAFLVVPFIELVTFIVR